MDAALRSLEVWLEATRLSVVMNHSSVMWPISACLHFIGLTLLLGTVGLFDLRLLGMAPGLSPSAMHRLIPWGVFAHMQQVLEAARKAGVRPFHAMHRRYRPGDYETWRYIAPIQKAAWSRKTFEYGTWGGEVREEFVPRPGEIVVQEHWCSSGFANTDLDLQLKKHGVHKLIVIGLIAHTCVEATVRYAVELGYEVTVVKDATADYSEEMMHAALDINLPNYANAIVSTEEIIRSISVTGRPAEEIEAV